MERPAHLILLLAATGVLGGCDPLMNVEGAFFPAWLVAMVSGLLATSLTHWGLERGGIHAFVPIKPLTYLAMFTAFTLLTWLVLYAWF
ncbi:MAG: YtcA family lipoprotein [Phycisphaerales bacterium]|nr:YtcA family lipoprotein [Phycisphaerales bacterium]